MSKGEVCVVICCVAIFEDGNVYDKTMSEKSGKDDEEFRIIDAAVMFSHQGFTQRSGSARVKA